MTLGGGSGDEEELEQSEGMDDDEEQEGSEDAEDKGQVSHTHARHTHTRSCLLLSEEADARPGKGEKRSAQELERTNHCD